MAISDTGHGALSSQVFVLPGLKEKASGFLSLVRPLFFILTPINAASASVLSLEGFPPLSNCILGFIAVAFASCAVNVFNDYTDRERDKTLWPDRAILSGRVRPGEALFIVVLSLVISLSIAWWVFNPMTFFILLLALASGVIYSVYLRDKAGYLSLPPIVGLIYLGGWAAFSPETLFTNIVPWYLYILGVVWQAGHIMIYYPLHIPHEKPSTHLKTPPALFFTPSPEDAVKIGISFSIITLILGALLPIFTAVSPYYVIPVAGAGIFALIYAFRFHKNVSNKEKGMKAFRAVSVLRLVISATIIVAVAMV